MKRTLIKNAVIVNEGKCVRGSVVIEGEIIKEILGDEQEPLNPCQETIDASGGYLLPGIIDEHVHFRDPGFTYKADIASESRAAVAGGVTSIMDMPNTNPQTVTIEALNKKFDEMGKKSLVNYSCYFGATNENYTEFNCLDVHRVCGIKVFMGSSTGDMLVDKWESLRHVFGETDLLVATHCEDQTIIKKNTERYRKDDDDLSLEYHSLIRSVEACYESSSLAVKLAKEMGTRLHVLHITTAKELELLADTLLNDDKRITAEVCVPHLLFTSSDYSALGSFIKCNPAIKNNFDKEALRSAVNSGWIDTIATDHAPHLLSDKEGGALKAASGMPMVQFSLLSMLRLVDEGVFSIEKVVEKMCHAPAKIYTIYNRGYIRTGYQADLVVVKPAVSWRLTGKDILSKCKWSPLEGEVFNYRIEKTFVNGCLVYSDGQLINENHRGQELKFRIRN
jgi:dihydroorotase